MFIYHKLTERKNVNIIWCQMLSNKDEINITICLRIIMYKYIRRFNKFEVE
jgi:hypothetical protein